MLNQFKGVAVSIKDVPRGKHSESAPFRKTREAFPAHKLVLRKLISMLLAILISSAGLSALLFGFSSPVVAVAHADGGAMTCGKKIIHAGDSQYLLISRFGEPENREFVGMVQSGDACVKAEAWLYVCRRHAKPKMYVIRIVGTTIVSIRWLPDVQ